MRACLIVLLTALTLVAQAAGTVPGKGKLFRWVDAQGKVHFGDRIPPEYAKQEQEKLDTQGRVLGVKPRQLTAAELAAAQLAEEEQKKQAAKAKEQQAHDRSLLLTYNSVADLQLVRDQRLAIYDQRILLAEKAAADIETDLGKSKAARQAQAGKADPAMDKRIQMQERALVQNLNTVESLKKQRSEAELALTADIERFKQLRAGQ